MIYLIISFLKSVRIAEKNTGENCDRYLSTRKHQFSKCEHRVKPNNTKGISDLD